MGLMFFTPYALEEYSLIDACMTIRGGHLSVDSWVCWKEGMKAKATSRAVSCMGIVVRGWSGMTQVGHL